MLMEGVAASSKSSVSVGGKSGKYLNMAQSAVRLKKQHAVRSEIRM